MTTPSELEFIEANKHRFFSFYYELDTADEPDPLVKRVYDNYLMSGGVLDNYIRLLENIRFLNMLADTEDPHGLFNMNTLNILFNRMGAYNLKDLNQQQNGILRLMESIQKRGFKLKTAFVQCLFGLGLNGHFPEFTQIVFTWACQRLFWLSPDLVQRCIEYLAHEQDVKTASVISNALNYYVKPGVLFCQERWNIDYELIESLSILRKMVIHNPRWIKNVLRQYPQIGQARQLIIVDGANCYYNPLTQGLNPIVPAVVYTRVRNHFQSRFGAPLTDGFLQQCMVVIVLNEKHREYVSAVSNIMYTPRGVADDAMSIYLWLSNPGSILVSNDRFNDWAEHIRHNSYMSGLWECWNAYLKTGLKP